MLERNSKRKNEFEKNRILNDATLAMGKELTAVDLIEYILDDSDYSLRKYTSTRRTTFNRINILWVYPVFLLLVPFQWLCQGDTGFKRESRIGTALEFLVKFD